MFEDCGSGEGVPRVCLAWRSCSQEGSRRSCPNALHCCDGHAWPTWLDDPLLCAPCQLQSPLPLPAGINLGPIIASVGGLGVVVGLASQRLLMNAASAIALVRTVYLQEMLRCLLLCLGKHLWWPASLAIFSLRPHSRFCFCIPPVLSATICCGR